MSENFKKPSNLPVIVGTVLAGIIILAAVGLVFLGGAKTTQSAEAPDGETLSNNIIFGSNLQPLDNPEADDSATKIVVYVDYRCPHCMTFDETNGSTLEAALAGGNVSVEIRPVTFMDRFSAGSAYSSRAAAAVVCAVENQPEIAWPLHSMLLTQTVQPQGEGHAYTNEEILDMVNIVTSGTNPEFDTCVLENRHVEKVQRVSDWTFENPVPGAANEGLRIEGTPLVLVSGEVYEGAINDPGVFLKFLEDSGVGVD